MVRTRILIAAFALLAFGVQLISGQVAKSAGQWPLEIVDFQVSMVSVTQLQGNMASNMGSMGMSNTNAPIAAKAGEQKLVFTLKSKNSSSTQTIAAVQWESRFTNAQQQVVVKQFKSKKKIKPNNDEKLEETLYYDAKLIPASAKVGLRIIKVEYTDNSVWENQQASADSDYIYKSFNLGK